MGRIDEIAQWSADNPRKRLSQKLREGFIGVEDRSPGSEDSCRFGYSLEKQAMGIVGSCIRFLLHDNSPKALTFNYTSIAKFRVDLFPLFADLPLPLGRFDALRGISLSTWGPESPKVKMALSARARLINPAAEE